MKVRSFSKTNQLHSLSSVENSQKFDAIKLSSLLIQDVKEELFKEYEEQLKAELTPKKTREEIIEKSKSEIINQYKRLDAYFYNSGTSLSISNFEKTRHLSLYLY